MKLVRFFSVIIFASYALDLGAQSIPLDSRSDVPVFEFLDEINTLKLSNQSYITRPLSRDRVIKILDSVDQSALNKRQKEELLFYQLAFSKDRSADNRPMLEHWINSPFKFNERYKQPDLFYYHKGKVTASVNPIIGGAWMLNQNGEAWQRRVGGEAQIYMGRLAVYGSVRDVYEFRPLAGDSIIGPQEGALYKGINSDGSAEFSETRGGITYDFGYGYVGFVRDYVQWGYGNGSNIFSINSPPFAQLKLHLQPSDWIMFDYFHGSLASDVIDSNSRQVVSGVQRYEFLNKYIAGNMLSLRPWKPLWISLGNSIIYSESVPELTYMIPVMFYKSADHYISKRSNNAGGNAQMFGAISIRPFSKLHLYSTLFVDELSFRNMFKPDEHTNWYSLKSGFQLFNLLPNINLTFEYVRNNPMIYKHFIETTTFENAGYNLGHYLRDNSHEFMAELVYKPLYWMRIRGNYRFTQKGTDYPDIRFNDPVTGINNVQGKPFLGNIIWQQNAYQFQIEIQPIYRLMIDIGALVVDRSKSKSSSYSSEFMSGSTTTWRFGLNYGL